jgi:hypothetical protein
MNRLNKTEPATFSILSCWSIFRDSYFLDLDDVFGTIDDFIHGLCRVTEEITEMSVDLLMHELGTCIHAILKGDTKYKFQIPFYVI